MINWNQYGVKNGECIYKNALKADQDIRDFVRRDPPGSPFRKEECAWRTP